MTIAFQDEHASTKHNLNAEAESGKEHYLNCDIETSSCL